MCNCLGKLLLEMGLVPSLVVEKIPPLADKSPFLMGRSRRSGTDRLQGTDLGSAKAGISIHSCLSLDGVVQYSSFVIFFEFFAADSTFVVFKMREIHY